MSPNTSGPALELLRTTRKVADGFASIAAEICSIVDRSSQGLDPSALDRIDGRIACLSRMICGTRKRLSRDWNAPDLTRTGNGGKGASPNTSDPALELLRTTRKVADGFASIAAEICSIVDRSSQGLDPSALDRIDGRIANLEIMIYGIRKQLARDWNAPDLTRFDDEQIRAAAGLVPLSAALVAPSALPFLLPKTYAACKS